MLSSMVEDWVNLPISLLVLLESQRRRLMSLLQIMMMKLNNRMDNQQKVSAELLMKLTEILDYHSDCLLLAALQR